MDWMTPDDVMVIDDPTVLRERIRKLETILELTHGALHKLNADAEMALGLLAPEFLSFMVVVYCTDDAQNVNSAHRKAIEKGLLDAEEAYARGDCPPRTVKR